MFVIPFLSAIPFSEVRGYYKMDIIMPIMEEVYKWENIEFLP